MSGLHNNTNHLLRALVGDFALVTIGPNGRFGLCIFRSPYNLGYKELLDKHLVKLSKIKAKFQTCRFNVGSIGILFENVSLISRDQELKQIFRDTIEIKKKIIQE